MGKVFFSFWCAIAVVQFCGCQGRTQAVQVIVDGGGRFPRELAGRWRAETDAWEFELEPSGAISKAVIALGMVEIVPGKATRLDTRGGGEGVFAPGVWTVRYDTQSRQLAVEVVIKQFYQDVGEGALAGSMTDLLIGPVSSDGTSWEPDWFTASTLVAFAPDPDEFYSTTEPEFRKKLVFRKNP